MSDYQYSLALTVTYIPYIIVEIPASLLLKRAGANIFLPTMVILWGFTTTLQGLVGSYRSLLAARFCLGLFEGGLLPGIMLVMSRFYKRDQIQLRMSLLFTAGSLAGAFSGLLASAILEMDGHEGRRGWQWIFILVCDPLCPSLCSCWQMTYKISIIGGGFHNCLWITLLLLSSADSDIIQVPH